MSNTLLSEGVLSLEESGVIFRSIEDRARRLDRCRLALDIEASETYRSLPHASRDIPARCRIVYQRAGEQVWQIAVFDENGKVVSDSASDGAWIDAGGKCWHIGYLYISHSDQEEEHALSRKEQWAREEAREPLEEELSQALWPMNIATGHLFLDFHFLTQSYMRDNWHFSRDSDSGRVVCRSSFDYAPAEFRFSAWEWLQWRAARLWRPGIEIEEYFDRKSLPRTEAELILNESCGFTPERFQMASLCDSPEATHGCEFWEEPVALSDGSFMPRVHTCRCASSEGEVLLRSTLVLEECAFGVNIPLNIRPVDRSKERVDW